MSFSGEANAPHSVPSWLAPVQVLPDTAAPLPGRGPLGDPHDWACDTPLTPRVKRAIANNVFLVFMRMLRVACYELGADKGRTAGIELIKDDGFGGLLSAERRGGIGH